MLTDKVENSLHIIADAARKNSCAVLSSFGKDSMVLCHLIRDATPGSRFPIPVIYHRHPWFPEKNIFADSVILSWAMEVHDWPPMYCGIKVKKDMIELVARYNFGLSFMDVPVNVLPPEPRHHYLCGVTDWIYRPKSLGGQHGWKTVFHGHKSSDVDQFDGHVPLNATATNVGGIRIVFPLRDWTDDDVWDYIDENNIPYQATRYRDRKELDSKWLNPDYIHACTKCIDPREPEKVFCPLLKQEIPNVSDHVVHLQQKPDYIK